ncbi:E3 ubiquitin-protein ligase [Cercospora beticola]|uniref:E3 ubiquitin-protein ligase n=1 Tax=Cercospora beticola TaxID=122368 RepID=A0A2G5I1P4_CERBT|nr:E3 ubiquitin-protein ligase [Cercospora beticola]PIA98707.1 E3 ubiquitin-protein ligase [Cercospora beticola]WPB00662.1 hypothetical protein RHO25_005282 [Cercospora beticola]CAK1361102.1 unnamed protein product [Cercospora beticola]
MERNNDSLFGRRGPGGRPAAPEDYQATLEAIIAWCTTLAVTAITRENELRGLPPPTSRIFAPLHRMLVKRQIRKLRRRVARELGILNDELARLSNEHTTAGFVERLAQSLEEFYDNVPTGFSKSVIDSIPQRAIGASDMDENGEAQCSICFEAVEQEEQVTELPCKHWFHHECVSLWLIKRNTCPICRKRYTAEQIVSENGRNDNKDNSNGNDESTAPSGSGAATEDKSSAVE